MVLDKKQNAKGKALVCTQVKSIKLLPEKFNFLYVCSAGTSFKNLFYFFVQGFTVKGNFVEIRSIPNRKMFCSKIM